MTTVRKLILIALVLLLISAGIVAAQSSMLLGAQRSALFSGGPTESRSYQARSVIGQPAAGAAESFNYRVTAGFLAPTTQQDVDFELWLPAVLK